MTTDDQPARFTWLPPMLRPQAAMTRRQERVVLLIGLAALFGGFDQNVYGFAIPQIQKSLHIAENQIGLTIAFFRLSAFVALLFSLSADLFGRRRLLLITIFGQAVFTLATAFSQTYTQFVWLQVLTRVFGYAEEMICVVVIVEEVAASVRGWATGTLAALQYTGAGLVSLCFAAVNILPGHWRALYVIGGLSLLLTAFLRRSLPETKRFEIRHEEVVQMKARIGGAIDLLKSLVREYPGRIALLLLISALWGLATGPSSVMTNMYLQKVLGYQTWQTTLIAVPGGLLALWLNILMGRVSDKIGRKRVIVAMMAVCGLAYGAFFSGISGWVIPPLWILSYFAYFTVGALLGSLALEIVPTAYRATVGGTRYAVEIFVGGVSFALEGVWYDYFHAHGPAISITLLVIPLAIIGVLFLPEPAGRKLEDISHA